MRAQQIDAENAAVLARFGEMQVNCGDYDNAIAELQRALRIDPEFAMPTRNCVEHCELVGRLWMPSATANKHL